MTLYKKIKKIKTEHIYQGDCLDVLHAFPDESIDCVVTSPPYWGLRDYGSQDQLGLEEIPDDYVKTLTDVFDEIKRVLIKEGTLWLNLGDTYHNKQLVGIPFEVAFALQYNGWYLRQDIIWHKPNPMPESVKDRCTRSHEYIFLLTKSKKYFYNMEAIKEPVLQKSVERAKGKMNFRKITTEKTIYEEAKSSTRIVSEDHMRNKRSVWNMRTATLKEAHFATFPIELPITCIKAGCPEGGVVLDPFFGAGTTGLAAQELHRNWVGIELNPEYIELANRRLAQTNLFVDGSQNVRITK